jgi:translation initiation factor 5A
MGTEVQLMDLETYETFNVPIPEEYKDKLTSGKELQYMITMGRKKITRV